MNQRNEDHSLVGIVIVAIAVCVVGVVWWVADVTGVDMSTAGKFLTGVLLACAILGASLWWGWNNEIIHISNVWPIVLAVTWISLWCVLDYHARSSGIGAFTQLRDDDPTVWWNAWYTKVGVLFLFAIPYVLRKLRTGYWINFD
ncbi:putative Lipoprotein (plasmid) [Pararobbsia alpina]|uniref:hypothetical protein n=1 Tax=Pararobbsia alpina TaxID=621374 RepID=UPI0039A5A8F0